MCLSIPPPPLTLLSLPDKFPGGLESPAPASFFPLRIRARVVSKCLACVPPVLPTPPCRHHESVPTSSSSAGKPWESSPAQGSVRDSWTNKTEPVCYLHTGLRVHRGTWFCTVRLLLRDGLGHPLHSASWAPTSKRAVLRSQLPGV